MFLVPSLQEALYNELVNQTQVHVPMHSEAKQTEILAFGAHLGPCRARQRQARRMGDLCPPKPKLPKGFQQSAFMFLIIFHYSLL